MERAMNSKFMRKLFTVAAAVSVIPVLVIIYLLNMYVFPNINEGLGTMVMVTAIVILTMIIALGGYLIIRALMSSLTRTLDQAAQIANGDIRQRISRQDDPEINQLAKSFNRITDELEKKITEVARSKKQLQTFLFRIGNALSVKQDIDDLISMVVDTTTQALDAKQGDLRLLSRDGNLLQLRKSCGVSPNKAIISEIKMGEGIEGRAAKENRPYMEGSNVICVPLTVSDKVIGTVCVYDKQGGTEFCEDDLEVLVDISAQVALALENSRLKVDQQQMFFETLAALAAAVEARDPYTRGHSKRVRKYAQLLAARLSGDSELIRAVGFASLVHDIGKISFPDRILKSEERIVEADKEIIKHHPIIAVKILEPLTSFREILEPVRHHHERFDGTGYPDHIGGNELSLATRILHVADVMDAMFSDRTYAVSKNIERGIEEFKKGMKTDFDPGVAKAAIEMLTNAKNAHSIIPNDERTANAVLYLLAADKEEILADMN